MRVRQWSRKHHVIKSLKSVIYDYVMFPKSVASERQSDILGKCVFQLQPW